MRPVAMLLLTVLCAAPARGDDPKGEKPKPEKKEKDPLAGLDAATRKLVDRVKASPTVSTPLGDRMVKSKLAIFDFLVDELDLTGRLVKHLGLGTYSITKLKDGRFLVDDRAGAVAKIKQIATYVKDGMTNRIYLADGFFVLPFKQKVNGDGVIKLGYKQTEKGVFCTAHIEFRARSKAAHQIGRAVRVILAKVIQKKSRLFIDAAQKVSEATSAEPERIHRLLKADKKIDTAQASRFAARFVVPEEKKKQPNKPEK